MTKPYPVLEYVVDVIKNTISDAKVEFTAENTATLKDGNDIIYLEQQFDRTGNAAAILIKDQKEIIFSEDLLEPLQALHEDAEGELKAMLQNTTIIVNGLNVATYLIFQAVKDELDQLSNSYEFVKSTEKEVTKVKSTFKFGKHVFELTVVNDPAAILVTPSFAATVDASISKNIEKDVANVQKAMQAAFK